MTCVLMSNLSALSVLDQLSSSGILQNIIMQLRPYKIWQECCMYLHSTIYFYNILNTDKYYSPNRFVIEHSYLRKILDAGDQKLDSTNYLLSISYNLTSLSNFVNNSIKFEPYYNNYNKGINQCAKGGDQRMRITFNIQNES